MTSMTPLAVPVLGKYWRNGEADWGQIEKASAQCRKLREDARAITLSQEAMDKLLFHWATFLGTIEGDANPIAQLLTRLNALIKAHDEEQRSLNVIEEITHKNPSSAWGSPDRPDFTQKSLGDIQLWQEKIPEFKAWCHWRSVRRDALSSGLGPLVEAFERDQVTGSDLGIVFAHSYYFEWVESEVGSDNVLNKFFSPEFEQKIQTFRDLDTRLEDLTKKEICARLAERLPSTTGNENGNSELGILRREMQKQRGHMSVRSLIHRIPNLLPRLKPCLLMSPISVTQYLDASYPSFDLVVFDEASQMPVWDAVGAIARGTDVIIVGDPKQLPPTNFFGRTDNDELSDQDDTVEDMESILDDCIAARLPEQYLRWHYRSRHESLIAFSNHRYYDNRLFTFPSPQERMAVTLRPILGTYDMGGSRTNRKEAEAIVEEIIRRLRNPSLSRYSIGVVTFSIPQQTLIEDMLDSTLGKDHELEAICDSASDPIFVKNLENVQGDERDVILFSICYGPDKSGKISMNFGPLNKIGGERRLNNVAITRARREVVVFSSISADRINLSRTSAKGVADLKSFLDYAERGMVAITENVTTNPDGQCESFFEEEVSKALKAKGYEIHHQVGCSGYRIDLGVVDPEKPGNYLIGIECDGANYHRAKTARDRDKLRESVLNDLGWTLHRVWSTDWWHSPSGELAKMERAIEGAKLAKKAAHMDTTESAKPSPPKATNVEEAPGEIAFPIISRNGSLELNTYRAYRPGHLREDADIHAYNSMREMARELEDVVDLEGPILLNVAAKRIAPCWGVKRCTESFVHQVRSVISHTSVKMTRSSGDNVLWPTRLSPKGYCGFRVPGIGEDCKRKVDEIPLVEIANGSAHTLRQQIALPMDDLVKETARLFGFQRMGPAVESRIREAVVVLIEEGRLEEKRGP